MAEIVSLTHADDRLVGRPRDKTLGREAVGASVVRDLQYLHRLK